MCLCFFTSLCSFFTCAIKYSLCMKMSTYDRFMVIKVYKNMISSYKAMNGLIVFLYISGLHCVCE